MNDRLQARLHDLRTELESGRRQMHLLDQRREALERTLLRISGAIQVLEELSEQEGAEPAQAEGTNGAAPQTANP